MIILSQSGSTMRLDIVQDDAMIKRMIPRTWRIIFSRWGRLRPIQRLAIPVIRSGENALLFAPTASGKTEAVMAPIIERALEEHWQEGSVFFISPTRALVNDLYERLDPLFDELPITLGRRTGDYREVHQKKWTHFILCTPEALDSLLCRFPEIFLQTRVLIFDELHMIYGRERGEQLRCLIQRIEWIRSCKSTSLQKIGLSATLANPDDIAKAFLGKTYRILKAPYKRELQLISSLPHGKPSNVAQQIVQLVREHGFKKVLIFTNTKAHAEVLGAELKKVYLSGQVFVHHGKLSRNVRLTSEEGFKRARSALCVATTTLEVGVDIGGIDAIGLASIPNAFESFIQRIGRGRRKDITIPYFVFYRNDIEKKILETFQTLIDNGLMPSIPSYPLPGAAVQQTFSYALQKRRVGASLNALWRIWQTLGFEKKVYMPIFLEFLEEAGETGYLVQQGELFYPGEKLLEAFEKGTIHSTIPGEQSLLSVLDDLGNVIAEIYYDSDVAPGEIFQIGGRLYKILKIHDHRVYARPYVGPYRQHTHAPFPVTVPMHWHYQFGEYLLRTLFPMFEPHSRPFMHMDGELIVIHALGMGGGFVWSQALATMNGWKVRYTDALQTVFIHVAELPTIWIPFEQAVTTVVGKYRGKLARMYGQPPWFDLYPSDLQIAHFLAVLAWPALRNFLKNIRFFHHPGLHEIKQN